MYDSESDDEAQYNWGEIAREGDMMQDKLSIPSLRKLPRGQAVFIKHKRTSEFVAARVYSNDLRNEKNSIKFQIARGRYRTIVKDDLKESVRGTMPGVRVRG